MTAPLVNVLYISYNGITEPLVESQVLSYLRLLTKNGVAYKLITYERVRFEAAEESRLKAALLKDKIEWHPFYTNARFGFISAAFDLYRAYKLAQSNSLNTDIIHARSFIPSLLGRLLKRKQNVLLLNDIRGFWVDEKVYKNSIKAEGLIFRVAKRLEAWILAGSDYIVSLSDAGQRELSNFNCFKRKPLPAMVTIPTCVDTQRFSQKEVGSSTSVVIGYVGSMSDDYLPHEVFKFYGLFKQLNSDCTLKLITRSDQQKIQAIAAQYKLTSEDYLLVSATPAEVPEYVRTFDVALSFIKPGFSKMASCPTKVGEYLSSGIPVVSNSGIGDVDSILDLSGAGIIIKDFSTTELNAAIRKVDELRANIETGDICRELSKSYFSLKKGADKYLDVYRFMMNSRCVSTNTAVTK